MEDPARAQAMAWGFAAGVRQGGVFMTARPLLVALSLLSAFEAAGLDGVPRSGRAPTDFVPTGWAVESTLEGNLTRDGVPDVVMVIVKEDGTRALVVLAREAGGFRLLGLNEVILPCDGCGGVKNVKAKPSIEI